MDKARLRFSWTNASFLAVAHLLAAFAIVYMAVFHFSWWTVGFSVLWLFLCGMAITGGYHRLFAHKTYRAAWPVRLYALLFGAASVQNSALKWAADHREHHASTDRDDDPYNAKRGMWWSHIGWVFFEPAGEPVYDRVPDLLRDPLVVFQNRAYVPLAVLFGAVIPAVGGLAWGDPWGALLCAGFLRLVIQYHQTFCINSLAHMLGRQPYSISSSARDHWLTALVTLGEGYHNYHHRFPGDYRNGMRWYQYDPTKWWIWGLSKLGLTRDLRRMPKAAVDRARAEHRR